MTSQIMELAHRIVAEEDRAAASGVTRPWLHEARTLADEVLRMHKGDNRALYVITAELEGDNPSREFVDIETADGYSVGLDFHRNPNYPKLDRSGPLYLSPRAPIDMVLHCWHCGEQHIDAPNEAEGWTNPPHRSHKCGKCGYIWRPADVETNGVEGTATKGVADSPVERPILREVFEHAHRQLTVLRDRFLDVANKIANPPMMVLPEPGPERRLLTATECGRKCEVPGECLFPYCKCVKPEPKRGFWATFWGNDWT